MKNTYLLAILLFAVSCTSPVENYIKNDFSRVVREDNLEYEVDTEIERIAAQMNEMAVEANPDAKESERLMAEAQRLKRDIESRLESFKRTGSYSYIVAICDDEDNANAMYSKSQRLKNKAKPYIVHVEKQLQAFTEALNDVECEELMNSVNLVKNDSVTPEYIFNNVVGVPGNFANPTEDELDNIALAALTNYFIDNPTPVIKISKYQKEYKNWYIQLSNDKHYLLNAMKCDNGDYEYEYKEVEDSFSKNSKADSSGKKSQSGSDDCDDFLDEYEEFVDEYVKEYKKLYKKSMSGDISVLDDLQDLADEAAEFAEEFEDFDGEMSEKQMARYLKITEKMTKAMLE